MTSGPWKRVLRGWNRSCHYILTQRFTSQINSIQQRGTLNILLFFPLPWKMLLAFESISTPKAIQSGKHLYYYIKYALIHTTRIIQNILEWIKCIENIFKWPFLNRNEGSDEYKVDDTDSDINFSIFPGYGIPISVASPAGNGVYSISNLQLLK